MRNKRSPRRGSLQPATSSKSSTASPDVPKQRLRRRGYQIRRYAVSYHFAGVHAIRITENGLDGGADPGRDGMALGL